MSRPYHKLRILLYAAGVTQPMLARRLLISVHTVSCKMNAHTDWTLGEVYAILDLLGEPPSEIPAIFPRGGHNPSPFAGAHPHNRTLSEKR